MWLNLIWTVGQNYNLGEGILLSSGCPWHNHLLLVLLLHLVHRLLKILNHFCNNSIKLLSHKKNRHAKASKQAKRSDHKHYLRGNYLRGKRLKLFPNPFLPVVFNWENLKVVLSWNWKKSDILNLRLRNLIKNVWNVYRTVISWKSSALLPEHANVQCNPSTKSLTSTSVYLLSLLLGLFSWLLALAHSRLRHHPHSTNLYLKSFIISIPFGKILFGQEHARPSGRWLQRRSSSQDFLGAL